MDASSDIDIDPNTLPALESSLDWRVHRSGNRFTPYSSYLTAESASYRYRTQYKPSRPRLTREEKKSRYVDRYLKKIFGDYPSRSPTVEPSRDRSPRTPVQPLFVRPRIIRRATPYPQLPSNFEIDL